MPAFGGSYSDPTFGTTTWRLAVPPANVNGITFPAYARVQAWNSDNTRMFVMDLGTAGVNMDLYDATTIPPTPINRITMSDGIAPDSADNDVLWSFTNPNRIYYNVGSSTGHGLELRYFDVSTCTSVSCVLTPQVVHTFACTTDATSSLGAGVAGNKIETGSGGQGGMFDSTDTYFSFTCDKVAGDGRHEIDLIRYNRLTDTVTTQTKWYNMCPGAVPSGCHTYNVIGRDASMIRMNQHPDSRYITIIWQTGSSTDAGWVRGEGVEIYDPAYTFLGVASPYDGHQDVGFDVNGVPVLVTVGSFRGNALDERSIGITDLTAVSPTAQTYKRIVLPCSFTRLPSCPPNTYFLGSKPGHISMTGTWGSLPGYALYSNMMVAGPAVAIAPRYPLPTTLGTAVSPGTVTVTPASMSQIGVGVVSMVDTSTSAETVVWTSVTATTATAVFAKTHANTANVYCLSCGETGFAAMENFAVKIDTTAVDSSDAQFWRIGRTMAIRDNEYNAEPHSTVNRDFTQILWGSTWNTDPGTSGPVYGFWTKLALPTRPLPPAVLFKATLTSNADSSVIAATPARKQLTNCATGYSGGSLQPAGVPVGQLYCTVANKTAAEAAGGPVQGVVAATSSGTGIAVVTNGQGAGGTHSPASVLDTYGDSTDDAVCMTDPHRSDPTAIGGIPPSGCVANSSAVFAETSAVGFPFPDTLWPSSYPSNSTVLDTASAYYRDVYFMLPSVSTTHVLEMDVNINSSPTAYAAGKGAYFGWGFQYNVAAQAFQYCPQNCSNWISLRGIDVTGAHADLTTYVLTSNHWYHLRQYGHRVLGCSFTSAVKCYFYDLLTVNDVTAGTAPITYRLVDSGTGQAAGGIPVDNHTWDSGPILQEQIDMVTDNATATAHIVSDTTVFYSAGQNAFWFGMGVN
jgi:hypothetical protein